MRKYTGIEIGRVFFACLIPFLHISFKDSVGIYIVRQYFFRLGVPFFFAVSGMFLSKSLQNKDRLCIWKRYSSRIGKMLFVWIMIYSPFILRPNVASIQKIVFLTPAFLWYLTGLLVASVPFCFISNRNMLYFVSAILYIFGTLCGDTYKWLVGGVQQYENIFLTTRNGIFFGLPLMCVGELTWKKDKASWPMVLISALLLVTEITIVGLHAAPSDDRSMYIMLPSFIFYLVLAFRNWNPDLASSALGGISSSIYLMQFGIITVGNVVLRRLKIQTTWAGWGIYFIVLLLPTVFYLAIRKTRLAKIIF